MAIALKVNGARHSVDVPPDTPLLWVIRDVVGLHGTKYGCGIAVCGACTVHVDGQAVRSCVTAVGDVGDAEVVTIEGLHPTGDHPVQRAWRDANVPQCGFCQTGQIMQAAAFVATTRNPTDQQVSEAMSGNICRCGCYQRIHAAVKAAGTGA
ncbi:MAG: Isoquinoline 1-oxidoreductase alpha subunit [uncultured Thermomicrobiales bacterium]|jgi:isoquinoline 1-oxidoreductase alpha subunit|uniref:Isoquinoline 1-oxidoreductase alpha subunit n=1 Tax=uncultured Thermomicrobiales bacterium TaxID=1645740 RepID=A0A6J4UUI0_9BACT|nr:MAG: Isoquinoline 1-oxidoreductase alpha subunit [uncultured Thermomicrobiales bacterium]